MRRTVHVLGAAVLFAVTLPVAAGAQQPNPSTVAPAPATPGAPSAALPPGTQPRYSFTPVDGGALKLDVETGKVSFCSKGTGGYACLAVPDSRDAYEAEIARLQAQLDARGPNAKSDSSQLVVPLPNQSDLDAAVNYATRLYQRLRAAITDPAP